MIVIGWAAIIVGVVTVRVLFGMPPSQHTPALVFILIGCVLVGGWAFGAFRRLGEGWVEHIPADHPDAVSRLDELGGVGQRADADFAKWEAEYWGHAGDVFGREDGAR